MSSPLDLRRKAKALVAEAAIKLSPSTFIKAAVADMDRADVEALASAYLLAQVKASHRRATLVVERDSERPATPTPEQVEEARLRDIEYERRQKKISADLWQTMNTATEKFRSALRMEWTDELLESEFATGDGGTVKWGDATRDQHADRFNMHQRNAMAGLEGAARHQQAIATLDQTGAATLRDAVKVAA